MLTVTTYAELADAVRRDETMLRLESEAKDFYEKKTGDLLGGGLIGALPGLMLAGPVGALLGAAVGAAVSSSSGSADMSERDIARFLIRYYRKSGSGVTYIELIHR